MDGIRASCPLKRQSTCQKCNVSVPNTCVAGQIFGDLSKRNEQSCIAATLLVCLREICRSGGSIVKQQRGSDRARSPAPSIAVNAISSEADQ